MVHNFDDLHIEEAPLNQDKVLRDLLAVLVKDNVLIIQNLGIFGKGIKGMGELMAVLSRKGVKLISILEYIESNTSVSFYFIVEILAETIATCQSKQVRQSITESKHKGIVHGRSRIKDETILDIRLLYNSHKMSLREIAAECQVSLGTSCKYSRPTE
ncbi:hypothetical protein [Vagococcus intermedius]|uniref:Resolvase/invertase-type recombinase catalytic domain-containing protein n=1 Tax=Vagococcus intermedius TaxID=2991418 RepID=A0AAF0I942_9ENTE|nr:hypothetical protein [Vagococcus intermedius]WEG73112.1 hypothetical protein OL234_09115 [Vagococcus intermedius]WEG75197.1 hypothetical protein OL235_09110 [Vagococcus intermedius]